MSAADLETALENIDDEILTLSTKLADPTGYTIEGLSVQRARMKELLEARKALKEALATEGSRSYEIHSRWV